MSMLPYPTAIRKLTREAIAVGYGNIDIDLSTLVDLEQPSVDEQQQTNYKRAAEISALIREVQPDGLMVSIGGEIGEVGKQNSTEEELRAYLDGYYRELERRSGPGVPGISKVSVQTGTSHGGVPLPDGGVAEVKLDFGTLEKLGEVARSYGLAGAVQHGASTLPDELFHRFPAVDTAEIDPATGFQNSLYDHPAFPKELLAEIEHWCFTNTGDERKPTDDACFLLGLAWICTFYVLSGTQLPKVPVFNDLNQLNLLVGIGFMAVGFSFATRWE